MSTYTPIASVTLSSAQSSVTFSGIPQTYTDLIVVCNFGTTSVSPSPSLVFQFNGDTGTNYSMTNLRGNGTTTGSSRQTSATSMNFIYFDGSTIVETVFANIMNYSNTTTFKTVLGRGNSVSNTASGTQASVGLWRSTSAINSITVLLDTATTFLAGTTFNLYGVANASITNVAKATGGDSVYTDGTYWYHIFRSSGTFTPTQALTADYLVVAGGGAGGNSFGYNEGGGGGGAGGFRTSIGASTLSLTAQNYTVTVGAGGAGVTGYNAGNNGSNSVFSTITSTGGGGGGRGGDGTNGGSGGGGGGGDGTQRFGGAGNTPSTSPSQGFNGGNGSITGGGGGGGGAGAVGSNATTGNAANGGSGSSSSLSGTSVTYAGGGGGSYYTGTQGSGGSSIGGSGSNSSVGGAGVANTGSGGGGYSNNSTNRASGSGGSGIVIVRYAA